MLPGSTSFACVQGLGEIVGTVSDPSGVVIPDAKITVISGGTGLTGFVITNAEGHDVIPSKNLATYDLSVEKAGFRMYTQQEITFLANQTITVSAKPQLRQASRTVTTTVVRPPVNRITLTLREVIEQRRVVGLPVNNGNAAGLALPIPEAVKTPSGVDQASTNTFPGVVTISTGGPRLNSVSFQLDGAELNRDFPAPFIATHPDNPIVQSFQIINPQTCQSFPGNQMDPSLFDSLSKAAVLEPLNVQEILEGGNWL